MESKPSRGGCASVFRMEPAYHQGPSNKSVVICYDGMLPVASGKCVCVCVCVCFVCVCVCVCVNEG